MIVISQADVVEAVGHQQAGGGKGGRTAVSCVEVRSGLRRRRGAVDVDRAGEAPGERAVVSYTAPKIKRIV
jgi:hypothetical protein